MSVYSRDNERRGIYSSSGLSVGRFGPDPRTYAAAQQAKQRNDRRDNLRNSVEWLFDRLSTTNYMAANTADQIIRRAKGEETDWIEAMKGSVTGKRDTTFSDVMRDHFPETDNPWFEGADDDGGFIGNLVGNLDTAGTAGFVMDVLFDPINFFTFGSTRAAQKAAKQYADEMLGYTFKQGNVLESVARQMNPNDARVFKSLASNPDKARKFINKTAGRHRDGGVYDFARKTNDMWKRNYREGLRMTEDEMRKGLVGIYGEIQTKDQVDAFKGMVKSYQNKSVKPFEDWLSRQDPQALRRIQREHPDFYKELQEKVSANKGRDLSDPAFWRDSQTEFYNKKISDLRSDESFQEMYDTLDRVVRGKEDISELPMEIRSQLHHYYVKKKGPTNTPFEDARGLPVERFQESAIESMLEVESVTHKIDAIASGAGRVGFSAFRKEWGKHLRTKNPYLRTYDKFTEGLRKFYEDSSLQSAVLSITDSGPMGWVKEAFGIRTPYQKALRTVELNEKANMRNEIRKMEDYVQNHLFKGFDDDDPILKDYFLFRAKAQDATKHLDAEADRFARAQLGLGEFKYQIDPDSDPVRVAYDRIYEMQATIPSGKYMQYEKYFNDYKKKHEWTPVMEARNVGYEDMDRLKDLDNRITSFMLRIDADEKDMIHRGLMDYRESMDNYLPYVFRRTKDHVSGKATGSRRVGDGSFATQTMGPYQAYNNEVSALQMLYGVDEVIAKDIVSKNGSAVVTDLKELMLGRGIHHTVMKSEANMLDSFRAFGFNVNDLSVESDDAKKVFRDPSLMGKLGLQTVDGDMSGAFSRSGQNGYQYFFDRDVAKTIKNATELMKEPGQLKRVMNSYTNWFKGIATTTPGFHIRNFYSGVSMLYTHYGAKAFKPRYLNDGIVGSLVGMYGDDVGAMFSGGKARMAMRMQEFHGPWTQRELVEEAKKRGIISQSSQAYVDDDPVKNILGRDSRSKGQRAWSDYSPLSAENKAFKLSRNLGGTIESSGRYQAFLMEVDELTANGNVREKMDWILDSASNRAKQLMLDYDDLTKFERNVMKHMIPFYTWIRKNLGNQMFMLHNPSLWGRMANTPKAINMLEDHDDPLDERDLPSYMRDDGYFAIGRDDEGNRMTLWPNLPVFDLNILPVAFKRDAMGLPVYEGKELIKEVGNMAHPGIKFIIEQWTGKDTFRDRDIQPTEEGNRYYGLIRKFPHAFSVLDAMTRAANNGRGLVAEVDSENVVQMNGELLRAIETSLPVMSAINRYIDAIEEVPEQVFNTNVLEESIDAFMGASDPEEGMEEMLKVMSHMLGIKATVYDEKEARLFRGMDVYNEALDNLRIQSELDPNRIHRRQDWMNRQSHMLRRLGVY